MKIPCPFRQRRTRSGCRIRQAKPGLRDHLGLGRDERGGHQDRRTVGYPRDKMLGVWWAGSEEDVIPAGDAAKGYVSAVLHGDRQLPGDRGSEEGLRRRQGQPRGPAASATSSITRGVCGMLWSRRSARQEKYGKGKVMTGEQMRWGSRT